MRGLLERREEELEFLKSEPSPENETRDFLAKKRIRKKKDDVSREFRCVVEGCRKAYGSENSLNQHIKLKHKDFWKMLKEKERSEMMKEIGI